MFKVLVSNEEARQTIAAQLDDIATLVKVGNGRPRMYTFRCVYVQITSSR
jgi:hypothetical protein